jgi:hypothetical protein
VSLPCVYYISARTISYTGPHTTSTDIAGIANLSLLPHTNGRVPSLIIYLIETGVHNYAPSSFDASLVK